MLWSSLWKRSSRGSKQSGDWGSPLLASYLTECTYGPFDVGGGRVKIQRAYVLRYLGNDLTPLIEPGGCVIAELGAKFDEDDIVVAGTDETSLTLMRVKEATAARAMIIAVVAKIYKRAELLRLREGTGSDRELVPAGHL